MGGNQLRHGFSTLGTLQDYKYYNDSVLLEASLIHDLMEDLPNTQIEEIRRTDFEGQGQVIFLPLTQDRLIVVPYYVPINQVTQFYTVSLLL